MSYEFCAHVKISKIKEIPCKICKREVPETCLATHEKTCLRSYECPNCDIILTVTSIKRLDLTVSKHICHRGAFNFYINK